MFKSAAAKIAHNSTIPALALAGNPRLQPLQEAIAAEKLLLQNLQTLSTTFDKSSEALRAWASGEGEDLMDTFSACSALMAHWVTSLSSFALHVGRIRDCLKAVRTREEALDDIHRRREALTSRAVAADRRVKKMGMGNKNLRQQTDLLMSLHEQIRAMDAEVMTEEASLGDWKRAQAREWMGILFDGLLDCSEKGSVVATFSRAIIGCVPTGKTEPGLPRANYSGQSQVKPLMEEAQRKLQKISLAGGVGDDAQRPPDEYPPGAGNTSPLLYSPPAQPTTTHPPKPYSPPTPPNSPPVQSKPPSSTTPSNSPPSSPYQTDEFGGYNSHLQSQPYASTTLPNSPPSSPPLTDGFGGYNPYFQSQTFTPGQNIYPPAQMVPASLTQSRMSPPPGYPGFTPDHQRHPSQSSTVSRSNSIPSHQLHPSFSSTLSRGNSITSSITHDTPPVHLSQFRGMPEIHESPQTPSEA